MGSFETHVEKGCTALLHDLFLRTKTRPKDDPKTHTSCILFEIDPFFSSSLVTSVLDVCPSCLSWMAVL